MNQLNTKLHCCHSNDAKPHYSLREELICHFPYALVAISLSLIVLSLLGYGSVTTQDWPRLHGLFHTLHFFHILFAATGTVVVFRKYSRSLLGALLTGTFVPVAFCTLSDAVIPYLGGVLYGLDMHFHWCFMDHLATILPFLGLGLLNGIVMGLHGEGKQSIYSAAAHFSHIFISAFASTVYLVSFGFYQWQSHMGLVFVYLLIAVLIPCTLADIVVPVWFGMRHSRRAAKKRKFACK